MTAQKSLIYRPDIDGLRMIAVVPVVLFHAGFDLFSGGYIGVDVFFVISGFLITGIIQREVSEQRFSIIKFYERRARRILPALFVVMGFCFCAGFIFLMPSEFEDFAMSSIATLGFASNFWFWRSVSDYFGNVAELSLLLHTWSLSVEEQFYIFFPILLILLAKSSSAVRIAIIAIVSAASFAIAVWAVPKYPSAAFFLLPARAWELGLGVMLALGFAPKSAPTWLRETVSVAALVAIIAPVVLYEASTPFPGLAALPPCIGAALLIWVGGVGCSTVNRMLSFKPFVWIGLLSYSLYLWHWPIIVLIGSIPEIGWNVPNGVLRQIRWGDPPPLAPNIEDVGARQLRATEILESLADTRDDVIHIPLTELMCAPVCQTNDGLDLYYWDDDHLTPYGAKTFVLSALIEAIDTAEAP